MSAHHVEFAVMETAMGRKRILTVGALREVLEGVADDVHVVCDLQSLPFDERPDWANVWYALLPDGGGQLSLTLLLEDTFDPRQF